MIHQHVKYLILFFFLSSLYFSQTIKEINFVNNSVFSNSELKTFTQINEGQTYFNGIRDSIVSKIAYELKMRSYFHYSIDDLKFSFSEDSSVVSILVSLDEGFPSRISEIHFDNLTNIDSIFVLDNFEFLKNDIFDRSNIDLAIEESLDFYENNGFPFAKFTIESINFTLDSLSEEYFCELYINLDHGKKSTIDHVEIIGNESTSDNVIIRNIRIPQGTLYNQKKIDEIPSLLNRLRFFNPLQPTRFYLNSSEEGILQITVKEKQTNNFDGIIGFVPPSDEGKGYFTGKVNVSLRNLFGTGRSAAFRWEQFDRNSQELEIKYLEPWLFNYPFNLELGLWQRKQDTTYVQRKLNASLSFLATESISASLIFANETTIPNAADSGRFTVFSSSTIATGFNLIFDTRDDIYSPTKGFYFLNSFLYNSKSINGPDWALTPETSTSTEIKKFEFEFSFFQKLFNRQILALNLNAKEMQGDNLEISDLYQIGGTNSLRGYRENQFYANRTVYGNLEYRYSLARRSYAFLFFDAAYLLRDEDKLHNIKRTENIKMGYGLGLSIETGIGVLVVSYALANGNSFSDGLIHFGIVNEF